MLLISYASERQPPYDCFAVSPADFFSYFVLCVIFLKVMDEIFKLDEEKFLFFTEE